MPEVIAAPFSCCPACGLRLVEAPRVQEFRCGSCGFRYFHNVACGVAVFMRWADSLLVTRRAADPAAGTLDLPGGFVDQGESLEQALARELAEELALHALPGEPRYLFSLPNRYAFAGVEYATTDLFFHIVCERPPPFTAGDDVASAAWLPLAALNPDDFGLASVRAAVRRYAQSHGEPR